MEIRRISIDDLKPYYNNPRKNDQAVEAVAESIRQCGYCAPIVVDENMEILAGHTRLKALKRLGYNECEVVVKEGLTDEQKRKYRLLDNKTNEFAEWDFEELLQELEDLDFEGFDFNFPNINEETKEERSVDLTETYQLIIDCESEEDMNAKYDILAGVGIECRVSTL